LRLFVAIWPSVEASEYLGKLVRPRVDGLRWVERDQWHVTLGFIGEADPETIREALAGVSGAVAVANVGPVTRLIGKNTIVAPVAGVDELAAEIRSLIPSVGTLQGHYNFEGHITLARFKGLVPPGVIGIPVATRFEVNEVCLVSSDIRSGGVVYRTLDRFPLSRKIL